MDFEEFWELYGKKVGKLKVMKRFVRLKKSEIEKIADHLPKYVESTPDIQFRKNPLTYLNGQCWEDEIITPIRKKREVKRHFPDYYDPLYIRNNNLSGPELSAYYAHLREVGLRYDKDRRVWKEVAR